MNDSHPNIPNQMQPQAYHAIVLLVDDQAFVGEAVRRALASQGDIDFHYCANPFDALPLANRLHPTVVLSDLVMPQMDGLALVRQFRANPATGETPIIVLSVKEDPQVKSDAFTAGANDYLVKLPDAIEMRARIRYHSRAHLNRIQRDEAFHALRESQQALIQKNTDLCKANQELELALAQVKQLQGLLPICCRCKKVRDDGNYWHQIESYITQHADVRFSHGYCPECYAQELKCFRENFQEVAVAT